MSARRLVRRLRKPLHRLGGLALAAAFAVSASTAPLTMLSCPWHQMGVHATGSDAAGADPPMAPRASHLQRDPGSSPDDSPHEHHGPCQCLGDCAIGLAHGLAASPPAPPAKEHALTRLPGFSPDAARPPMRAPRLLPYPNGPPTTV